MCLQRARQKCERKRITQEKKRKQDNERSKNWEVTGTEITCTLENCYLENRSRKEREEKTNMHDQPLWGLALISDESQKLAIDGGLGCSVDVARETMSISSCIKTLQCEF